MSGDDSKPTKGFSFLLDTDSNKYLASVGVIKDCCARGLIDHELTLRRFTNADIVMTKDE